MWNNIWIRSQNKTILKNVNDVRIAQIRHFKDEKEYFPIVWDSWEMYDDRYLGNYSTKEKALKVLDMIQEFINCIEEYKAQGEYKREIVSGCNEIHRLKTFVFQMPQDESL